MPAEPLVSIVLTTYNRPRLLNRALFSIHRQTFTAWELLVVADGPPDGETRRVIERFARRDPRVRPVYFRENARNPAMRMNQALALARAPLVAFQDDDDLWYPDALAHLVAGHRAHPEADLVYGAVNLMDARKGHAMERRFARPATRELLARENPFCNNAVLVKRSALERVGGYDESCTLRAFFDWDLWRRLADAGARFHRVDALLGEVWAFQPDSVGRAAPLDYARIERRVRGPRRLPLRGHCRRRTLLFLTHGHHPSIRLWRVDFLVEAINARGSPWRAVHAHLDDPRLSELLARADAVLLYRCERPTPDLWDRRGGPGRILYDLDDAVFHAAIPEHLHLADGVFVSTPALREHLPRGNVFLRPNGVPRSLLRRLDALPRRRHGPPVVAWLAGLNPNDPEDLVVELGAALAEARPGTVFHYFGKGEALHARLREIPGLVVRRDPYVETEDLFTYYRRLLGAGVRVVVAPLTDGPLNRAKSPLKLLEAALLGVPLVVSPVGAFREAVRHGENAFFAETPAAFAATALALVREPERARAVAAAARRTLFPDHFMDRIADRFLLDLEGVTSRLGVWAPMAPRPRREPPVLSVVIVNWNTEDLLFHCLQSLREHPFRGSSEVIVVDNASEDDSVPLVRWAFPEVRLVAHRGNAGYARANNQGVTVARGEFVLLLNPDTEVTPGALDRLVDFLRGRPDVGAVTPQLRDPDGRLQPSCLRFPTRLTLFVHDTFLGTLPLLRRARDRYSLRDFDHRTTRPVDQAPGTCLLLRRRLYRDVGGMDPGLFLYFNDVDLCRRLRARGASIWFLAEAQVVHHGAAAVRRHPDYVAAYHRDRIAYYRKHFGRSGKWLARGAAVYAAARTLLRRPTPRRWREVTGALRRAWPG